MYSYKFKTHLKSAVLLLSLLIVSHSLVGCAAVGRSLDRMEQQRAENQRLQAEARSERMERECVALGFKRGTNEIAQCKLMLEVQKRNAAAIYKASPKAKEDCERTFGKSSPWC